MIYKSDYVLWGTGKIAMEFYALCVKSGRLPKPLYLCDSNPMMHGKNIDGIKIITPDALMTLGHRGYKCGKALTVVIGARGTSLLEITGKLVAADIHAKIYTAMQIMAEIYFSQNERLLNDVMGMFSDSKSVETYGKLIKNTRLGRPVDCSIMETEQYFGNDVIPDIADDEIIVDGGVDEGTEIDKAYHLSPKCEIYAFEPNHQSFFMLNEKYKDRENIHIYKYALWNEKEMLSFDMNRASPAASSVCLKNTDICSGGVEGVALDDVLDDIPVTFIKMDIEGSEYNALLGSKNVIKKHRPKLAISVYHSIDDYVRIPLLIRDMNPDYRFYFRQHGVLDTESVFYAV